MLRNKNELTLLSLDAIREAISFCILLFEFASLTDNMAVDFL